MVMVGDLTNAEAFAGINAFHDLYRSDYPRLKAACDLREQRQRQRQAELAANPPRPEDITIHYWKVQPEKKGGDQ